MGPFRHILNSGECNALETESWHIIFVLEMGLEDEKVDDGVKEASTFKYGLKTTNHSAYE